MACDDRTGKRDTEEEEKRERVASSAYLKLHGGWRMELELILCSAPFLFA